MKKIFILILSFGILITMTSCQKDTENATDNDSEDNQSSLIENDIDNTELNNNDNLAVYNISSLEKIDLNYFKFNSDSTYYREATLVDIDGFELDKSMFYIVNDGTENNFIEVSEVMLEPIKLLYDYGSNGLSTINSDQLGYIKANEINLNDLKLIEKCIPINFDLKIEQEITLIMKNLMIIKLLVFGFIQYVMKSPITKRLFIEF